MNIKKIISLILTLMISSTAIASIGIDPQDPFEVYNRYAFTFNNEFDKHFLQPVAKTYRYILFPQVRTGVTHFYQNIDSPAIVIDDVLQGDFANAMGDSWRFFINSTLGIFGIFDVAGQMNVPIPYHYNDFGLTLAHWGIKKSCYFVIPFLGPSTVRDTIGIAVDYYGFGIISRLHPFGLRAGLLGLYYVNTRANLLDYQNVLEVAELDPYVFQRNAYLQRRDYLIEQMQENIRNQYANLHSSNSGYFLQPSHWK